MFCQKCGTENNNDALFCSKCGNSFDEVKTDATKEIETSTKEIKKKIASAHVLNIVAGALLVVCLLMTVYFVNNSGISSTTTSNKSPTTTTTNVSFEDHSKFVYITSIGAGFLFLLGLAIYKSDKISTQKKYSLAYMLISIPVCAFSVFASFINSFATCGLSFLLLACCIMQIVVGAKFYMATKSYDN